MTFFPRNAVGWMKLLSFISPPRPILYRPVRGRT